MTPNRRVLPRPAPRPRVVCSECARTVYISLTGQTVAPHKNWEGQWCTGALESPGADINQRRGTMRKDELLASEARRRAAAYGMKTARRRYRAELRAKTARGSFRAWARRTYNAIACAGKLQAMIGDRRVGERSGVAW